MLFGNDCVACLHVLDVLESGLHFLLQLLVLLLGSQEIVFQSVNLLLELLDRSLSELCSGLSLLQFGCQSLYLFFVRLLSLISLDITR